MSASPVKERVKKGFYMADTPQSLKNDARAAACPLES